MDSKQIISLIASQDPDKREQGWGSLSQCPEHKQGLARLARDILSIEQEAIPCDECRETFPEYLAASPQEREEEPCFQAMQEHMAACAACWEEYALYYYRAAVQAAGSLVPEWIQKGKNVYALSVDLFTFLFQSGATRRVNWARGTKEEHEYIEEDTEIKQEYGTLPPTPDLGDNVKTSVIIEDQKQVFHLNIEVLLGQSDDPAVGTRLLLYQGKELVEARNIEIEDPIVEFNDLSIDEEYMWIILHGEKQYQVRRDPNITF